MNDVLSKIIDENVPKFNKNVVDGIAKEVLQGFPEFLDEIFKSSIKSLSTKVDLEYLGFRRLQPKEEFVKLFPANNQKITYDLASSNLYMIELDFIYMGENVKRYLYLPFAEDGSLMNISNTMYHIAPVLSDTVISPSHKEVFARLLKDKLIFKSVTRNFVVNDIRIPGEVIFSQVIRVNEKQITDNIGKPLSAISLYLLGKMGLKEVFRKYLKTTDVIVTSKDDIKEKYKDTHNCYESTKVKPRGLKESVYVGHDIKILVPKTLTGNSLANNLIYGLIYVLDILPNQAEDFDYLYNNGHVNDEILYWRILLGRIVYKNSYSVDRIVTDIDEHFHTLDGYMDMLTKGKLSETGINVNTFFDLVSVIIKNYNHWLLNSKEYNSDIKNRYIDITYYLLFDIIVGFNKAILNMNKRSQKKKITVKELTKIFQNELSSRKIYGLVKSQSQNLCVMVADYSGDIKYSKVTSILED